MYKWVTRNGFYFEQVLLKTHIGRNVCLSKYIRSLRFLYRFWPIIDDALKKAAVERHVEVRLLASHWNHTRKDMTRYLMSLSAITGATGARIYVVSTGATI